MASAGQSETGKHTLSLASQDSSMEECAEKRIKLDPTRLAYEKEVRRQAAALVDAQNQVIRLQIKLQTTEQRERECRLKAETEREELRRRTDRAEAQVTWMRADLEKQRLERTQLTSAVAEARSQQRAAELAAESGTLASQRRAADHARTLTEDLEAVQQQLQQAQSQQLVAETAQQLAESRLEEQLQLAAAGGRRSDGGLQLAEVELALRTAEGRVKELENLLKTREEDARLGSLLQERLAEFPILQEQNRTMKEELGSLRHMVDRTLFLEEQVAVLKKKADRFDELQRELETLRAEYADSERQLTAWREAAGGDVTSSADLAAAVEQLRRQLLLAEESAGTSRAERSAAEARCGRLQAELDKLQAEQKHHSQTEVEAQVQLRKLQRKLTLVTMERDGCKRVLDAYEAETTTSLTTIELQRAEDKDKQLTTCRQQLETLERQLQLAASTGELVLGTEDPELVKQLRDQLQQLQQKHEQLQEEKEGLEAQLEERALRGDYNPATSRVLSLRDNPAAGASSQRAGLLERLRAENAELLQRVKVLSDSNASGGGISQEAAKQISVLRSQLRASELRMRRLKEVFSRSTQELRQAVSQLTGYKVNVDGKQIKLRSVYAPRPDQVLLFQSEGADTIQLLETSFSAQLSDLVDEYLYRQDSMPGFIGALTLRLLRDGPPTPAPVPAADDDDCEVVELD